MKNERFKKASERVKPEIRAFVAKNLDIVEEIMRILEAKQWTQKTLAQQLGKSESEISKWLTGAHNFTLQSIIKLEQILGSPILVTPVKHQQHVVAKVKQQLEIEIKSQAQLTTTAVVNTSRKAAVLTHTVHVAWVAPELPTESQAA